MTQSPRMLLIGPYDPLCGEYTFLAPPLGVWRLAGRARSRWCRHQGLRSELLATGQPLAPLERELLGSSWDFIGVSTTGMTLRL